MSRINLMQISFYMLVFCQSAFASEDLIKKVTQHFQVGNFQEIFNLKSQINLPKSPYETAYIHYRLAFNTLKKGKKEDTVKLLTAAEKALKTIQNPKSRDFSLLASVYSLWAGTGALNGPVYGAKSSKAIKQAEKLDPQNPQVFLVKGVSAYHTPMLFGGSNKTAAKYLDKAINLYRSSDLNVVYSWGNAESLIWRAIINLKDDNNIAAERLILQVLEKNPKHQWAKEIWLEIKKQ